MVMCEIPRWEQGIKTKPHVDKRFTEFLDKHNRTRQQHKMVKISENKFVNNIVYGWVRAVGTYTQIKLWTYQQFDWSD